MKVFAKYLLWFLSLSVFPSELSSATGANCTLSQTALVEDLDIQKFYGVWFAYQTENAGVVPLEDISHTYQPDGQGGIDVFLRERIPDRECSYAKMKLKPSSGETSAKLTQVSNNGEPRPFWVLRTDYKNFAVVYGCSEVNVDGGCTDRGIRSAVWVRRIHQHLTQNTLSLIKTALQSLCTDPNKYSLVKHNQQGCRQCKPSQWTVQPNFHTDDLMERWYVAMSVIPGASSDRIDYEHVYSRDRDRISLRLEGRRLTNPAECEDPHVTGASLNLTGIPGVMRLSLDGHVHDYRVVSADNGRTAFILGCDDVTPGADECGSLVSWVLTRDRHLSGKDALWISGLLEQYCILSSLYTPTSQPECSGVGPRTSSFLLAPWIVAVAWLDRVL